MRKFLTLFLMFDAGFSGSGGAGLLALLKYMPLS
jgi:hypothetical protein